MSWAGDLFRTLAIHIQLYWVGTSYVLSQAFRRHRRLADVPRRDGQLAVVTGGNRGIGWETTKKLVEAGMHVIVGCRGGSSKDLLFENVKKYGLPSEKVEWIDLDLFSMDSVRQFAEKVLQKNQPVHLLVNNAGIMFVPYALTTDGFESHFAVNYLGHFLLTHLLMPRLTAAGKEGQAARVLNVSSSAHHMGYMNFDDLQMKEYYSPVSAYGMSKIAQIMFTFFLDAQLASENTHVHIHALHPGIVKTNLYRQTWYARMMTTLMGFVFIDEVKGADTSVYVSLSDEVEKVRGGYFENCKSVKPNARARDLEQQKKLWETSLKLLNIDQFGKQ